MTTSHGLETGHVQALRREFDDLCQMLQTYGRQVPNEVRSALLQLDRLSDVLLPLGKLPDENGDRVRFANDRHVAAKPAEDSKAAPEPVGWKLDDAIVELVDKSAETGEPAPKKAGKKGSKKGGFRVSNDPKVLQIPKDIIIEGVSIPNLSIEGTSDSKESSKSGNVGSVHKTVASMAQASLTGVSKFVQDSINLLGLHQYH